MRHVKKKSSGKGGITLRDVVVHMEHMEQRLSSEITGVKADVRGLKADVTGLKTDVQGIKVEMKQMERRLTQRIDALDEDLTATMKDTLRIRKHVGMPLPLE